MEFLISIFIFSFFLYFEAPAPKKNCGIWPGSKIEGSEDSCYYGAYHFTASDEPMSKGQPARASRHQQELARASQSQPELARASRERNLAQRVPKLTNQISQRSSSEPLPQSFLPELAVQSFPRASWPDPAIFFWRWSLKSEKNEKMKIKIKNSIGNSLKFHFFFIFFAPKNGLFLSEFHRDFIFFFFFCFRGNVIQKTSIFANSLQKTGSKKLSKNFFLPAKLNSKSDNDAAFCKIPY